MFEKVPLILTDAAGDCGLTPILIRLVKVGCLNADGFKIRPKSFKLSLVADGQMNVRGMVIARATVEISVLNSSVRGLNSLVRDRNVAAADCIKVGLGNLGVHDVLSKLLAV